MAKVHLLNDGANWGTPLFASPIIDPKTEKIFWCSEQYFRWHMSTSKDFRKQVQEAVSGKQLLYLTKKQTMEKNGWPIREDWDDIRYKTMLRAQRYKFRYNPLLAQFLLDTGTDKIIYDVQYDDFFGTGKSGGGANKLGKILEKVRGELRTGDLQLYTIESYGDAEDTKKKKKPETKRSNKDKVKSTKGTKKKPKNK